MRRFLCVCALILTGMLSTAGCGAMNPVSNEPEPVSAADCSPMPASSAESKQEPAYPQPYAALTGVLKQPLTTDLYWYFDPLLGDNVGYLNMDGAVVWNTTTAASRDAAEKYRQEHPWVDTEQKISTFFGNGSCAVAEGKILKNSLLTALLFQLDSIKLTAGGHRHRDAAVCKRFVVQQKGASVPVRNQSSDGI